MNENKYITAKIGSNRISTFLHTALASPEPFPDGLQDSVRESTLIMLCSGDPGSAQSVEAIGHKE